MIGRDMDAVSRCDPSRVRSHIEALIVRGNVTLAELLELRMNSFEWAAIVPALTSEALIHQATHALANCARGRQPPVVYEDAVVSLHAPELLKRLSALTRKDPTMPAKEVKDVATLETEVAKLTSTLTLLFDLEDAVRGMEEDRLDSGVKKALKKLDEGRQRRTVSERSGE